MVASYWLTSAQNHNRLYEETLTPLVGSASLTAVSTDTNAAVGGSKTAFFGYPTLAFRLGKNLDNNVVRVKFLAKVSNASATLSIRTTIDGTDTVDVTTTSTAGEWLTANITPTKSGTDRQVAIYLKVSNASYSGEILAVGAYIVGAAPGSGTLASYFVGFDTSVESPTGSPISTKYVQRIGDGPIRIAKDRPMTLATVMDNALTPRANMTTTSTSGELSYVGRVYLPDTKSRTYKIMIYQGPAGTTPVSTVKIGPIIKTFSGAGWVTDTFSLAGSSNLNFSLPFTVQLKSTSGASVGIGTLQIRREP
jgi:hypothetical protein